jgi:hypothetical protein
MALGCALELPNTTRNIAVLTDSRASLQALEGECSGRQDLVMECRILVDRLFTRGTDVSFVWIPSHTGIVGNDAADAAAKAASNLTTKTDIGYTVNEICSRLRLAATRAYAADFRNLATENGWFDPQIYSEGVHPNLPPYLTPLFYRLRVQTLRFNYINMQCPCSEPLDFCHLFLCRVLGPSFQNIRRRFGQTVPVSPSSLLCKHPDHGWRIAAAFCRELSGSSVGHLV